VTGNGYDEVRLDTADGQQLTLATRHHTPAPHPPGGERTTLALWLDERHGQGKAGAQLTPAETARLRDTLTDWLLDQALPCTPPHAAVRARVDTADGAVITVEPGPPPYTSLDVCQPLTDPGCATLHLRPVEVAHLRTALAAQLHPPQAPA
jgi:hypothetical protein